MHCVIPQCFRGFNYSLIKGEESELEQFPQLPIDVVKIILRDLKLSEISKLARSCKQWYEHTGPYLRQLKNEAICLSSALENDTYIPTSEYAGITMAIELSCWLSENTIKVCRRVSKKPEFFVITAIFEVHMFGDDACSKSLKAFFCLKNCENYCSNNLRAIKSVEFTQNFDRQQKEYIYRIVNAINKIVRRNS